METYDEIYDRMCRRYEQESGKKVNETSDIEIRLKVLAGELFSMQSNLDYLKRQLEIEKHNKNSEV